MVRQTIFSIMVSCGIKIPNKEQFMLDPDISECNLIDRMQSDIKDFKNMLAENPEEDIFEFMFELNLSINIFPIIECDYHVDPDGFTGCAIFVITQKIYLFFSTHFVLTYPKHLH